MSNCTISEFVDKLLKPIKIVKQFFEIFQYFR